MGDGNLNLVLKFSTARASAASSLSRRCPTYAASANRPLTLDRARLEAQTPVEHYQHSPQHTVKIHHFDPELAVMVMEDLSSHRIWRGELIRNNYYPQAARQLGNIWLTPFSTPAILSASAREKRRWQNSSTRRCARSPKICSSTIRTRSTRATATRPSWKTMLPPCATTRSLKSPWPPSSTAFLARRSPAARRHSQRFDFCGRRQPEGHRR